VRVLVAELRVAEVPSHEARRIHGASKLNTFRDGYRVLRTIARERQALRRGDHALLLRPLVPAVDVGVAVPEVLDVVA
jgi:hypothetical protein